jgi:hypothetical protein
MPQHVLQVDPAIVVVLLTVHDIVSSEVHTVTTGSLRFDVVINSHIIETTNVNLRTLVTRLLTRFLLERLRFVVCSLQSSVTRGIRKGERGRDIRDNGHGGGCG